MMGCGASPLPGNVTVVWSYVNGNSLTYSATCFRNSMGVLCLSPKCRATVFGFNVYLQRRQTNTLNSTFNATKWSNASGMGCAMFLLYDLNDLNASNRRLGWICGLGVNSITSC